MNIYVPFGEGSADYVRASAHDALRSIEPLSVEPVSVTVSDGNPALVARLLDPRPIGAAEWAAIEGGL